MNCKRFGIPKICNVREHLKGVDKLSSGLSASFDPKHDYTAPFTSKVFLVLRKFRVVFKPGEADPLYTRVVFEMFGNRERVFAVAFHAER